MIKENRAWKWSAHILLMAYSIVCLIPLVILLSSSLSNNISIIKNGYSLLPSIFDFTAYEYLWSQSKSILNAFGISVIITIAGTCLGLFITALLAYPLSRRDLPGRNKFTFYVIVTLLFNGGMLPTYLVYTKFLNVLDSILGLILPFLLVNGFYVLIMRTFFMTTIPESLIESAKIDGAKEIRIFASIILPLSRPVIVTIGLLQAINYWNDWFNGLLFIRNPNKLGLQSVLNQMIENVNFLASLGSVAGGSGANIPSKSVRMAVAFIGIIPILFVYVIFQKQFVRGITIGAIKG